MRQFTDQYVGPMRIEAGGQSGQLDGLLRKLGREGWLGIPIPADYGGGGRDYLSHILVVEELSQTSQKAAHVIASHIAVSSLILLYGTEEQRRKFLVPLAKGEQIAALVMTEWEMISAVREGLHSMVLIGNEYIMNKILAVTVNGYPADTYLIACRTDGAGYSKELSIIVVPKGTPGVSPIRHPGRAGLQLFRAEVVFRNCRVSKKNVLGRADEFLKMMMSKIGLDLIGVAAQAIGVLQAAMDESIKYSKTCRSSGGPLFKRHAALWLIPNMANDLLAARYLTYQAASLCDRRKPFTKEASIAKRFASEAAVKHTVSAMQIQGEYSRRRGTKVQYLARDAKIIEIYESTSEVMRTLISGYMLC